jgi:formylglycine-generating enzyme required for sulfatase activity
MKEHESDFSCERFEAEIYAYLDNELSDEAVALMETHVSECSSCSSLLEETLQFEAELKDVEVSEPSTDMAWERFRSRLDEDSVELDIHLPEPSFFHSCANHVKHYAISYGLAAAAAGLLFFDFSPEQELVNPVPSVQVAAKADVSQAKENTPSFEVEDNKSLSIPANDALYKETLGEHSLASMGTGSVTVKNEKVRSELPEEELPNFDKLVVQLKELNEQLPIPSGEVILEGRQVMVDSFLIDKYPVTNQEYDEFVKSTHHPVPFHWEGGQYTTVDPDGFKPVTYVSWNDAQAYCRWENKALPDRAQWLRAARGDKLQKFPWGDKFSRRYANTSESGVGLREVGTYPGNVSLFGVREMTGNIREWLREDYSGKDVFSTEPGQFKVMAGGAFTDSSNQATLDYFFYGERDTIYGNTGIRCVSNR